VLKAKELGNWAEIEKLCERLAGVLPTARSISQVDWDVKKIYWRMGMIQTEVGKVVSGGRRSE